MEDVTSLITIEPWKNQYRNASEVELNKALTLLGFGAWSSLEPSKNNVRYNKIIRQSFQNIDIRMFFDMIDYV